ncbi:hypothetical protein VKT23_007397 [Stygiomarasmius scandens]|uniref:Fungal-type protein kinase domain-containing protein n=1 Tax=Marasmiellus scandens TaxID=2682957 RepID=A0ABR1JMJ7_9AGAR
MSSSADLPSPFFSQPIPSSTFVTDSRRFSEWLLAANICLVGADDRPIDVPAGYEMYRSHNIETILQKTSNPLHFAKALSITLNVEHKGSQLNEDLNQYLNRFSDDQLQLSKDFEIPCVKHAAYHLQLAWDNFSQNTRDITTVDAEYQIISQYVQLFRSVWRDPAFKPEHNQQLDDLRKKCAKRTRFRAVSSIYLPYHKYIPVDRPSLTIDMDSSIVVRVQARELARCPVANVLMNTSEAGSHLELLPWLFKYEKDATNKGFRQLCMGLGSVAIRNHFLGIKQPQFGALISTRDVAIYYAFAWEDDSGQVQCDVKDSGKIFNPFSDIASFLSFHDLLENHCNWWMGSVISPFLERKQDEISALAEKLTGCSSWRMIDHEPNTPWMAKPSNRENTESIAGIEQNTKRPRSESDDDHKAGNLLNETGKHILDAKGSLSPSELLFAWRYNIPFTRF